MSLTKLNQPLDRRGAAKVLAMLLLVALALIGGWQFWHHYKSRPLDTADVRQAIRDYLYDQTGERSFKPLAVEASTNSNLAASGDLAAADAGAKKKKPEKLKKKSPPPSDSARLFRQLINEAPDYKTIYRVIGQSLALADQFLAAKNPAEVETALALTADACRAAHDSAVNDWLAARIAEGYLWPGLEFADSKDARRVRPDFLLNIAEDAFRDAEETNNLVRNYRLVIAHASKPGKADNIRFRLARLLEEQSDFTSALAVLRELKDTNSPAVLRRIAVVEQQLKEKTSPR
jgi:hypothetical protein